MSHKKKEKKHPSEFLNEIDEWSEKQYNPGYWTGGNIPPHIRHGGKLGGILLLIIGILIICFLPLNFFSFKSTTYIISIIFGIVLIIAGLKKIMARRK